MGLVINFRESKEGAMPLALKLFALRGVALPRVPKPLPNTEPLPNRLWSTPGKSGW